MPILDKQPVDIHEHTVFMTGGRFEITARTVQKFGVTE